MSYLGPCVKWLVHLPCSLRLRLHGLVSNKLDLGLGALCKLTLIDLGMKIHMKVYGDMASKDEQLKIKDLIRALSL